MTPFEQHMRKYHPDSTTARLSREVEELRAFTHEHRGAILKDTVDKHVRAIRTLDGNIKKLGDEMLQIIRESSDD